MLLAQGKMSGRITSHGADGRWSLIRISRNGMALLAMPLYQVGGSKGYARATRKASKAAATQHAM